MPFILFGSYRSSVQTQLIYLLKILLEFTSHSHTQRSKQATEQPGRTVGSHLGFGVSPSAAMMDDLLYLLSHSCPISITDPRW